MAESAKTKRFREKNERELWTLIAMAGYVTQCHNSGDGEGQDIEMSNFADRVIKLIESESRRKKSVVTTPTAENVTIMVSKKA